MYISFGVKLIKVSGIKWILKICVSFAVKYSNEDLRKDEIVCREKKYIMKITKIEVGNARGWVEGN